MSGLDNKDGKTLLFLGLFRWCVFLVSACSLAEINDRAKKIHPRPRCKNASAQVVKIIVEPLLNLWIAV